MAAKALHLPQRLVQRMAGVALEPRSFGQFLKERMRLLRLLSDAPRIMTIVLVACLVLQAVAPAMLALVTGRLVGELVAGSTDFSAVAPTLIAFAAVMLAQQTGIVVSGAVGTVLGRQIDRRMRHRLRAIALGPSQIDHLERTEYQDELRRASDQGVSWRVRSPGTAAVGQLQLIFRFLGTLGATAVVASFSIWLAAGLLGIVILIHSIIRTQWVELAAREDGFAFEKRQTSYCTDLAVGASAGKEVRLFGLADWVVRRRGEIEDGWVADLWRSKNIVYGRQAWILALAVLAAAVALAVPGLSALGGGIAVGDLAMYVSAAWGIFGFAGMGHEQFDIERGTEAVRAYDRLNRNAVEARQATRPEPEPDRPPSITLEDVAFEYRGGAAPVLSGLDLEFRSGEVTAIVGDNGAGKTTVVKLLAGLYRPSAGRVLVDGAELDDIGPAAWQRRLSCLFQDYIRYPLSVAENVALGSGGTAVDDAAVREALRRAGVDDVIAEQSDGLDTLLSSTRSGGSDLSGGQWQRLALARVLYAVGRGADVVVLDEPTAHLDVQAEARFFDDVIAAVGQATVILISHRLSTVRHADRIVLLREGRISEVGDHDTLMVGQGHYARLFELQASRFT